MRRLIIALLTFLLVLSASYSAAESAADRNPEFVYDADGIELFGIGSTRKDAESAMSETPEFTASVLVEPNEEDLKFSPSLRDSIYRFVEFGSAYKAMQSNFAYRSFRIEYECGVSVYYDCSKFTEIRQGYADKKYSSESDERDAAAALIAEVDNYFLYDMTVEKIEILEHSYKTHNGLYVGMPLERNVIGYYDDLSMYFFGGAELSEEYVRGLDDASGIIRVSAIAAHDGGFVERIVIDVME